MAPRASDPRGGRACLPWMRAELELVRPEAVILLGATAAEALVGPSVRVTRDHGRLLESEIAPIVTATIHPSAVLRSRTRVEREASLDGLVDDLRSTIALLEARPGASADRPATEQVGRRRGDDVA